MANLAASGTVKTYESCPVGTVLLMGSWWENGQLSFDESESGKNALMEYEKSADQGNCDAMLNLGSLYFKGSHGVVQSASQAQMWYSRAESCFGKQFADMQALASRYRSLAAAGHLPVPPAPATPISGSRFFTRKSPTQPPELSAGGHDFLAGMVALAAVGLAYAVMHPEQLSDLPPASGSSQTNWDQMYRNAQRAGCTASLAATCNDVFGNPF